MNLDKFFRTKSRLFTEGRLAETATPLRLPMPIFIDGNIRVVGALSDVVWILARYRRNLQRAGYERNEYELLAQEADGPDRLRAVVRWTNLDRNGRVISRPCIGYYFLRTVGVGWQISLIEVLSSPDAALIEGTGLEVAAGA